MVIGIDSREARGQKSGKSRYTYHMIQTLVRGNPDVRFVLYGKENHTDYASMPNVEYVHIEKRGMFWHSAVAREWKRRVEKNEKQGEKYVYFSPTSFIVPFLLPKKCISVVTVHDLIAFKEKTHQRKAALIERVFAGRALRKAARILVPSHNTAKDLAEIFPYSTNKIIVTPLGVDNSFFSSHTNVSTEKIILTVGGLEPRKNIATLVDAFLSLDKKFDEYCLYIIGGNGWNSLQLAKKIKQHADKIRHLTDVSGTELPNYYQQATIFVFPSLYEGFGLPPLEAMASGTPVICANASSLPEVCGVSALLFNPLNTADLREKMTILLQDDSLRETLSRTGLEHAQKYTWEHCAETSLAAMRSA